MTATKELTPAFRPDTSETMPPGPEPWGDDVVAQDLEEVMCLALEPIDNVLTILSDRLYFCSPSTTIDMDAYENILDLAINRSRERLRELGEAIVTWQGQNIKVGEQRLGRGPGFAPIIGVRLQPAAEAEGRG